MAGDPNPVIPAPGLGAASRGDGGALAFRRTHEKDRVRLRALARAGPARRLGPALIRSWAVSTHYVALLYDLPGTTDTQAGALWGASDANRPPMSPSHLVPPRFRSEPP